jgi:hypothetical protein
MGQAAHTPIRSCKACRISKPKNELQRWVLNESGDLILDKKSKLSGRGAYVCSKDCYNKIHKQLPRMLSKETR